MVSLQLKQDKMEINKILEKENLLFSRKEIHFEIESNSVPRHEEVKKILAEKFSLNPELIRTQKISGKFGTKKFDVFVDVYDSKKDFDRVVKKTKQEKDKEKKVLEEKKTVEAEAKRAVEEVKKAKDEAKSQAEKPVEEKMEEAQ